MEWLHDAALWVIGAVKGWGYGGIIILMMLESTVFPIPSELVMPPAGYLASKGEMSMLVAIFCGTLGSVMGATINYYAGLWLGRPFILRYGKYFLLPPHKFEKTECFFVEHGEIGTFTGRLILGIRHVVSIPAGLSRMKMSRFLFFTAFGSCLWVSILAVIGYVVGENEELITKYAKEAAISVVVACVLLLAGYIAYYRRKKAAVSAI